MGKRKPGQYWDVMWNPIKMLCTPASDGCTHCWHRRFAIRHAGNQQMPKAWRDIWSGKNKKPLLDEETLKRPLSWKKPQVIFVQTMGDLFHESVPFRFQQRIWCEMLDAGWHLFLVLTKRPKRLLDFYRYEPGLFDYPIGRNIMTGISAESQEHMDARWYPLCQVPGRHWASIEPMLGPVGVFYGPGVGPEGEYAKMPDWVAYGPETGPGARLAKPDWMDGLHGQCVALGIPHFDKRRDGSLASDLPN